MMARTGFKMTRTKVEYVSRTGVNHLVQTAANVMHMLSVHELALSQGRTQDKDAVVKALNKAKIVCMDLNMQNFPNISRFLEI